jgi:hypothetical protein
MTEGINLKNKAGHSKTILSGKIKLVSGFGQFF